MSVASRQGLDLTEVRHDLVEAVEHDVRASLTAIAGFAELLQARDHAALREQAVRRIGDACERLEPLVESLMVVLEVDCGGVPAELEPVPLRDVLVEAADGIEVVCDPGCRVLADRRRLVLALRLLLGYGEIDDAIVAEERGSSAVITLSGIRQGGLDVRPYAAGLLIEATGGSAWRTSRAETAPICIILPRADAVAPPGLVRVLLVDDDESVRRLVTFTLPHQRFDILEAGRGDDALAILEECVPDLVVLDWRLPGATGEAVLRRLRSLERDVPTIVLTAGDHERDRAVGLGAGAFLTKPFSPLELLEVAERLLGERLA